MSLMWQMSAGRDFQSDGLTTEYVHSLNWVEVGGTIY